MKAKEIIKIIENICPERLAYSWDNVGLLCGDENKDVKFDQTLIYIFYI